MEAADFGKRDLLQNFLPAGIAVILFSPFITTEQSLEGTLLATVLLAYPISILLYRPVGWFSNLAFLFCPTRQRLRKVRVWWAGNWDYQKLFHSISSEDRNYLYLTAAYIKYFNYVAFYLFAYFVLQLFGVFSPDQCSKVLFLTSAEGTVWDVMTPMFGGWRAKTLYVAAAALVGCAACLRGYLAESHDLFDDDGSYVVLSNLKQVEAGGIARSIWGKVYYDIPSHLNKSQRKVLGTPQVTLEIGEEQISTVACDSELDRDQHIARFQFVDKFSVCSEKDCTLVVRFNGSEFTDEFRITAKDIPELTVDLRPTQELAKVKEASG
ncbi:hypothetical protein GYB59_13325 [bacterium]|nr:hypothetical protein [bacterium]